MLEKMKRNKWKSLFSALVLAATVITATPLGAVIGVPWITTGATVVVGVNEAVKSGALDKALAPLSGERVPHCHRPGDAVECKTCHGAKTLGDRLCVRVTDDARCETCHLKAAPTGGEGGAR